MMVKYKKKIQKSGINSWCHKRANGANEYWLKVAFLQLPNCKHVCVRECIYRWLSVYACACVCNCCRV